MAAFRMTKLKADSVLKREYGYAEKKKALGFDRSLGASSAIRHQTGEPIKASAATRRLLRDMNIATLVYLFLAVGIASAYLLIKRITRWHEDVLWRDGYRFARFKLAHGLVIMPHERGTGVYAAGVLAAEEEHRTGHAASTRHSTAAAS